MGLRPISNFPFRDQCSIIGGSPLKQRGLAGRRKGDGGAELGFPSNGLYREGAVFVEKSAPDGPQCHFCHRWRVQRGHFEDSKCYPGWAISQITSRG